MGDAVPGLLISIALAPVCAAGVLTVVKWMFNNEIDALAGVLAILVLVGVMFVTITSRSEAAAGAVLVVLITLMAFFPYAVEQVAKAEVRGIDIDRLDRAYKEISERPENAASYFALADFVYELGLPGHAVAIAEKTLDRLSRDMDPLTNQSIRDLFRAEEHRARQWKRDIRDSVAFRPVRCHACGHMNEPGNVACGKCRGPYLLEIARKIDPRVRIRTRLVIGWALIASFFVGTIAVWSRAEPPWPMVSLFVGMMAVGGTLAWLFRHKSLSGR